MKANSLNHAQDWVENAKNFYRLTGRELALAEFSNPNGMFTQGEMYIFVLDSKGTMLAHGIYNKFVGKDFMEVKDSDEKYFIREIVESASMDRSGFVEYKWFHPTTKEWIPKITYFEVVDDLILCSAVYW
jgi:cytochrome c